MQTHPASRTAKRAAGRERPEFIRSSRRALSAIRNRSGTEHCQGFARFKAAITKYLDGVEGKHKPSIKSLLTLNFQTFESTNSWPVSIASGRC